jgi:hypothetical protein
LDSIPRAAAVSDALCIVEVWRRYYKSSTALPPPFVLPWLLAPAAAHRAPSTAHPRLTMTDSQGFYGWSVLFRRSGRALLVSWRGAFVDRCVYHHHGIVAAATAAIHVTRPCRHRASNSPSPSRTIRRSPLAARRSPLTAHRSPRTAHRSPLAHLSPLTAHRSPLTCRNPVPPPGPYRCAVSIRKNERLT